MWLMKRARGAWCVALAVSALAAFTNLQAQKASEPSRAPVLRIETGRHTGIIKRIGVDAANRYLVSASDDKTVRVWELSSGRLLRIIRPPLGAGNEGKLFAVAISPDGKSIAAAGYTGYEWEESIFIYLFDRASGKLIRRLGGFPNVVNHLAYSPDGQYLAATLGSNNGVRVYQTPTYTLAGEDKDYGDTSRGADFDRTGRLATTSDDGFVRLYAPPGQGALRLLAKSPAAEGKRPSAIQFSPDGTRLAVGFREVTKVSVLSTRDLSLLYAPDTDGIKQGDLNCVAWSADGGTLYAGGGAWDASYRQLIRAWSDGGRGSYHDLADVAKDTITHILPLRAGGIIYGAGDPAFGALNASGKRTLFTTTTIADYRDNYRGFLLSPDGAGVGFGYEALGVSPARFSLTERKLEDASTVAARWRVPVTENESVRITDWRNTVMPKLNGTPLKLAKSEGSRSLAIAPDASAFLIGGDYYLHLFDRSGAQRWESDVPGTTWAVNISADGRLAVAAYSDGTIRWHSMKDGKELLAFFPHKDRKRWVLWTPSGYYDASAGGEDLIGWHVNNGKDAAADFFPAGQFRTTFYRPDVVSKILGAGDEQLALKQANDEAGRKSQDANVARVLPPVVEIISPQDSSTVNKSEITIRFSVRTPSDEAVTKVRFLVDGRPIATPAGLGLDGDTANGCLQKRGVGVRAKAAGNDDGNICEARISLPERDSLLSVIAENRFAASVPATVSLRWSASSATANAATTSTTNATTNASGADSFIIKPKLYVLAIGVGNYANPDYKLTYPAKDARDFAATLERQKGGLYRDVIVKVLTDEKATKDDVLDGLDWIRKETTSKDVAMILLAGHGINDSNGDYYFMPHNADIEKIFRTGVPFSDVRRVISALAGKTLFFVDTCHSGNVLGTASRRALPDINGVVNELSSAENGAVVFAASTGKQYSLEKAEWQNGAFTKAVVEAFNGRADFNNQGRITINMLDLYISERVKELTGGQQTPTTAKPDTVPDFPVVLKP